MSPAARDIRRFADVAQEYRSRSLHRRHRSRLQRYGRGQATEDLSVYYCLIEAGLRHLT